MQTRAEYQRARRAALVEPESALPAIADDNVVSTETTQSEIAPSVIAPSVIAQPEMTSSELPPSEVSTAISADDADAAFWAVINQGAETPSDDAVTETSAASKFTHLPLRLLKAAKYTCTPTHAARVNVSRKLTGSNLRLASLAAVAAAVTISTFGAGTSGAAEVEYLDEAVIVGTQVQALAIDGYGDTLEFARGSVASRSASRADIAGALGDQVELADPETLASVSELLSTADLVLSNERRATPEVIEEIQITSDTVRELAQLLGAMGGSDDARVLEVLEILAQISAAAPTDNGDSAAADNPENANTELVIAAAEPLIAPETAPVAESPLLGRALAAPLTDLDLDLEPEAAADPTPEVSDNNSPFVFDDLIDPDEELIQQVYEEFLDAVDQLDEALSNVEDAELPIPIIEPRPLNAEELIAALIIEAQADGQRLHDQYAYSFSGFGNGRIPDSAMQNLSWAPTQQLRPDAATQLERLNEAFRVEFGMDMGITSTYRSFAGQVAARARVGGWAATPGTSNHGWGVAVDFTRAGIGRFGTAQHRWMQENAPKFGWVHPDWARQGGRLPEPWHWEFWGTPDPETNTAPSPGILRGTEGNQPGQWTPSESIWTP